ncbi:hypothetical protein HN51_017481 [Arachis hypogaea]|uniref:CSC1-like protein RXW8 n=1 Tax=Arachis hypogaea TaxID=3818 RepID=A0A445CXE3_ARAHY|nr:CSC1-like protein RXW8 [Arachis ipaensis]XP_020960939.1 CSC1-like protein RXW8 [Arachis ipaensis]XP_020960940.1 CSC1-like protein RXW8 [Arachis ipaensis]XP_020960941.1 CSC1-like protein RXW8 [Arachis ipaensis]XP_025660162.1 CSC1-like protein RXW8 isoform X1 [Arachis hypogaea]XP_025660163.1 CSC1-like protein RXW8 isoform X1 [Arachis hypogaea]XP_025660164.1 CSC1-like protein RXW8 isoform X1 [Arachis hypogaea]QHN88654.1 CSC1-like protein [Arachis hypogaea]RYR55602.1 hypothetical protein Ahy
MEVAALLTSAGINIAVCVTLFSIYSVLRKQPSNFTVYFGRRVASKRSKNVNFCLERFVPTPSWILKAWETTEDEILGIGGLDAVVFVRILVFSLRVFSIAAAVCLFLVLPVNYHGKDRLHKDIPLESMDVFTIANVQQHSEWLWAHCLALYVITFSACSLLFFEYKSIANLRTLHIIGAPPSPSLFTILVRSVPWSPEESYCETVKKFFSSYHASTYLSHQIIYKCGTVQKMKDDAEHVFRVLKDGTMENTSKPIFTHCCSCGGNTNSFQMINVERNSALESTTNTSPDLDMRKKECAAAFVFFKSRYAALLASKILQSSNPMLWVTDVAPEPQDVYWSNICIPYRQLWIRKIATLIASIAFMLVFLLPVTFVQGLTQLDKLQKMFPFLTEILKSKMVNQVVTGYLPSLILVLFLFAVPPMMMLFSSLEGCISRSGRKKSACWKVLYFLIWNVFFVNVFTGSVISQLSVFSSVADLPVQLAKAVPSQATFFTTYIFTSGWASLGCEIMQIYPLLCNFIQRLLKLNDDSQNGTQNFPYHTEVPRILLFGFLGFTNAILAPIMLPFLIIYFFLAYLVYRNQFLNVYVAKYDSGGQYWPIVHNTTVFSLIFAQIIALGVFGVKHSPVASGFTFPLVVGTFLFHQYCRQRFLPSFKSNSAQTAIDMDRRDEESGKLREIHQHLHSAYCQYGLLHDPDLPRCFSHCDPDEEDAQFSPQRSLKGKEILKKEKSGSFHRTSSTKAVVLGGM